MPLIGFYILFFSPIIAWQAAVDDWLRSQE